MNSVLGRVAVAAALLAAAGSPPASAQTLAQRVAASPDGVVRLSFAARPGVCGSGGNIITSRSSTHWESRCDEGPVRVLLTVRDRSVVATRTFVGGRWRPVSDVQVTDLGTAPAAEAADFLLDLASTGAASAAKDAILPATLADSADVIPALLRLARDTDRSREVRRAALFWVGQAAGEAATEGLEAVATDAADDRRVREHAVFALSQRPRDEGVPALIRIARENRDPSVRKAALFWLAQSGDPRAIELFEELLLARR